MWKHIASNALSLFVVGLIILAGLIAWGQRQYSQDGPLAQAICFQVPRGATMRSVSAELLDRGAIANDTIFRIGADYSGLAGKLKAGSYLVPAEVAMDQIVTIVTQGGASTCGTEIVLRVGVSRSTLQLRELDPATNKFVEIVQYDPSEQSAPQEFTQAKDDPDARFRISLAEGATSWQIVQALSASGLLENDVAATPPEGSLAPDSYEFSAGDALSAILARMTEKQTERLSAAWDARVDGLPLSTPQEALILASIIEKETGIAEERRQVASVFVNRLNQGIRLQTDPTVIYGITEGKAPLGRGLRQSELRRETPYNTYVIGGLPPTPIANPGLASIEAALDPATTDFIFFVADGTGGHAFAKTLAEHNRNVAAWRAKEAAAGNN